MVISHENCSASGRILGAVDFGGAATGERELQDYAQKSTTSQYICVKPKQLFFCICTIMTLHAAARIIPTYDTSLSFVIEHDNTRKGLEPALLPCALFMSRH